MLPRGIAVYEAGSRGERHRAYPGGLPGVDGTDKLTCEAWLNRQTWAEAIVPAGCGREGLNIRQGSYSVSSQRMRSMQNREPQGTCPSEEVVKPPGLVGGRVNRPLLDKNDLGTSQEVSWPNRAARL